MDSIVPGLVGRGTVPCPMTDAEGVIVPQSAADGEGLGVALGRIVPALQLQDRIVQLELGRGKRIPQSRRLRETRRDSPL